MDENKMVVCVFRQIDGDIHSINTSLEGAVMQAVASEFGFANGQEITLERLRAALATEKQVALQGPEGEQAVFEIHTVEA